MLKKSFIVLGIILVSGLSGIVADKYLFPHLASTRFFSKFKFLKDSAENVTVINKTEQVYVKEDYSVQKIAAPVASSVVNIVSFSESSVSPASSGKVDFQNGTGVIVTSDGIIMTFASAIGAGSDLSVSDATSVSTAKVRKYKIMDNGGNVYDADLLGVDSWSNLAFLKINASNLPVISFGDFSNYAPGEKMIAIGNSAPQYQNQFSSAVINEFDPNFNISGKSLSVAEKLEGVFRVDFVGEKNFVGGPIVDYSGQTAGILGKTEKNGREEYFAIPSQKVKRVLDKVIAKTLVDNPILGIYYIPLNKSYALANGLEREKGALVFSSSAQQGLAVISGTPAQKAGLKLGDIIIKIGDDEITPDNNLSGLLYKYKKGDQIELTLLRENQEMKVSVQL